MMKKLLAALLLLVLPFTLHAGGQSNIKVLTQNQYLGADLTPIITAGNIFEYNAAALSALSSIAANNIPERAQALAHTIGQRRPHLVGLQEMFRFDCIPVSATVPDPCAPFEGALNDHLALTMAELGKQYYVAAVVDNLNISPATAGITGIAGLPIFLDGDADADALITVLDRDVILARKNVPTNAVPFGLACARPSADGCNFDVVAEALLLGGLATIKFERGFVGVDALVKGQLYRFVNTHLEVQFPAPDPSAPVFQAAQATQLIATLAAFPSAPGTEVIVVGDINSSSDDGSFPLPLPFPPGLQGQPPYAQFTQGVDILGQPLFTPYADAWLASKAKGPGYTCCELADLSNAVSLHNERIDVVFSQSDPTKAQARVLDTRPQDKTMSGLWPSDHASVYARLGFDDDSSDD
ncbi:MAG: endonuclease/exonuclease/phosphatase family protein [Gammaproteobacteria bacterium]|nr:endonuclease/exonuclease/phosphatase family protein [Gammaproteobacteria bacterium]